MPTSISDALRQFARFVSVVRTFGTTRVVNYRSAGLLLNKLAHDTRLKADNIPFITTTGSSVSSDPAYEGARFLINPFALARLEAALDEWP